METLFLNYVDAFLPVAYGLIFIGLVLEGELVFFATMVLVHQGHLALWGVIPVALAGVLLGDYLWYRFGVYAIGKENRIALFAEKAARVFGSSIAEHPLRTLLVSKFTYGLHRSTLISLGMSGVTTKTFLRADIIAVCFWMSVVGSVAFIASISLTSVKYYLKYAELSLLVAILAWFVIEKLITKYVSKKEVARHRDTHGEKTTEV